MVGKDDKVKVNVNNSPDKQIGYTGVHTLGSSANSGVRITLH